MADLKKFDPTKVNRNKPLAWDAAQKPPKAVYTSDLVNDDGSVNAEACAKFSVAPASVGYLTVVDLDGHYRGSAKEALEFHARESNMTSNDLMWKLVIQDAMQDKSNETLRAIRPVTDKARERAFGTVEKMLRDIGLTDEQVKAKLAVLAG